MLKSENGFINQCDVFERIERERERYAISDIQLNYQTDATLFDTM